MLIYVDDIIVTGSNFDLINQFISQHRSELSLNDLDDLHYFLGIEVIHNKDGLFLTQSRYALDVLERTSMKDCKPMSTPLSTSYRIRESITSSSPSSVTSYRSIVGAL